MNGARRPAWPVFADVEPPHKNEPMGTSGGRYFTFLLRALVVPVRKVRKARQWALTGPWRGAGDALAIQ